MGGKMKVWVTLVRKKRRSGKREKQEEKWIFKVKGKNQLG